jgi:uncharacterized protein YraI
MKSLKLVVGLTVALAALPGISQAQLAYAAKQVNLRAGPGMEYPVVAILLAGVPVTVQGCVADYRWCDVEAGPSRGWVYGGNIVYPYQGSNVPVISYGAMIGIGILAYSVTSYWDQHYIGRPWYPQRQRWIHRPPPPPHATASVAGTSCTGGSTASAPRRAAGGQAAWSASGHAATA